MLAGALLGSAAGATLGADPARRDAEQLRAALAATTDQAAQARAHARRAEGLAADARGELAATQEELAALEHSLEALEDVEEAAPDPTRVPHDGPGSRAEPIAPGTARRVGEWEITVLSVRPDATQQVVGANALNVLPPFGSQFLAARLRVAYVGPTSGTFGVDMTASALGPGNVTYDLGDGCGVVPDALADQGEVFGGGTVEGVLCWAVTHPDAQALLLIVEDGFALEDTGRTFFRLTP